MPKLSSKKNIASMQVLKTLQILLQGNFTMHELVEKLNSQEPEPIFNNSVVSKYINTCRYCGIEIPKIHNKYFVTNLPFGLDLTAVDIDLLGSLQNIVRRDMTSRMNKLFNTFLDKLNRFSNKRIMRVEKDSYKLTAEMFENAVSERRQIKLMLKNGLEYICIPIKMIENQGRTFFNVFYKNKDRMIDAERVSGLEVLSRKFIGNFNEPSVIFELKGGLAQRYALRENEQLLKPYDGESIKVANRGEGKDILLARLLRYDKDCEIINPKSYRDEMFEIIDAALNNYGSL